ncbi:MFS general substrate transporter [Choiromyces venosus 120613-1]|uniref:MFS general substrate transporter n=1 Tax=Choiromyces venosus 120613-1 TaxID=1336337 RepID=A0A3N4JEZ9_9PEZI|nr:MFS general substrate transporter [Choiromyces venosus 120613-1]
MSSTTTKAQSSPYNESTPLLRDNNALPTNTPLSPVDRNAADNLPQELSFTKLCIVLSAIWVGVFLGAVDTTVITTLLAPVSSSFSSFNSISWIATGYLIANAALQPLFGKLTDIYGRQYVLVLCNVLFGAGTLMCGLAKNQYTMIMGRVIAGAGGGGLMTISSIIATDLVPLRKRGVVQGGGNIAYGAGAALGGVYGGFVHDWIGWRWAFLLQIPFIVISAALVLAFVRIPVEQSDEARHRRIDYLGSATLMCSLVTLLLALNTGGNTLPWTHPLVLTCLPLSVVLMGVFFMVELWYAKEPVIPVRLLGNRTVLAVCFTNWFMVMSVFAVYFYAPIYFILRGYSSAQAGLRLAPFAVGISIGSLGTGLTINATGKYYLLGQSVMLTFVLGVLSVCTFTLTTPIFPQFFYFFMVGTGYGGALTVALLALISAVDRSEQAVITSASYAFRSTGSTIGTTVGSAIFQNVLVKQLHVHLGSGGEAEGIIQKLRERFDEFEKLPEVWKGKAALAYMDALHAVFWTAFGLGVLAFVCCAYIREHTLHRTLDRK